MPHSPAATLVSYWSYVRRFPDKHNCHAADPTSHVYPTWLRIFLKFLFCLSPRPGSLQNRYTIYKQQQTHIQYIIIQHDKHHKYRSNTTMTHQNQNITSPRMHRSSLRRVIVLRPSTAYVERCLGERFSLRGVML
jgi:hypothetical protein